MPWTYQRIWARKSFIEKTKATKLNKNIRRRFFWHHLFFPDHMWPYRDSLSMVALWSPGRILSCCWAPHESIPELLNWLTHTQCHSTFELQSSFRVARTSRLLLVMLSFATTSLCLHPNRLSSTTPGNPYSIIFIGLRAWAILTNQEVAFNN